MPFGWFMCTYVFFSYGTIILNLCLFLLFVFLYRAKNEALVYKHWISYWISKFLNFFSAFFSNNLCKCKKNSCILSSKLLHIITKLNLSHICMMFGTTAIRITENVTIPMCLCKMHWSHTTFTWMQGGSNLRWPPKNKTSAKKKYSLIISYT
jgi:hypothetical protein